MTIREILNTENKVSNVEEFFALLYNQKIHPAFSVFSDLSINFNKLTSYLSGYYIIHF